VPTERVQKDLQQMSASFWLQVDPQFNEHFGSRVLFEGDYFELGAARLAEGKQQSHFRGLLREGYLSYSQDGWDIKVGKQIIPWGKSDAINPTDFLSGKDYTILNPDEEVRRTGATGVQMSWVPSAGTSAWTFTGVWLPIFAQSKNLIDSSVLSPTVVLAGIDEPDVEISNSEVAGKLAYSGDGWDVSLSGFSGWDHRPLFEEKRRYFVGTTPFIEMVQGFRRINAVGVDGSWAGEKWIFRGESAFVQTENYDGTFTTVTPSHWDTVLGVERPFGDHLRIQFQAVTRYFPNYKDPEETVVVNDPVSTVVNRQIAMANALVSGYQDQFIPSGTLRVSYTDEANHWDGEVFYLQNMVGSDYLVRPKFSVAATDSLRLTAGADLYGGPRDRPLGALRSYSSLFIEAKYVF
jgi:hypothetical protein